MLSPRMLHRLTCCAEEIQLEVECSAEDVDWGVAVSANAATSALFNAVYLSEFIPARIVDRLSWNGWVGCEYKPATTTEMGLGWFRSFAKEKA